MFLEAIILLTIVMVALSVGMLLLKFVFSMVLLPFKLVFFLAKGLLGLVILIPLLLIFGAVVTALVPLGALLLFAPLVIFGGVVAKLVGC